MRKIVFATMDLAAIPEVFDRICNDWHVAEYHGRAVCDQAREVGNVSSFAGMSHFLATNSGGDLLIHCRDTGATIKNFAPGIAICSVPDALAHQVQEQGAFVQQSLITTWATLTDDERRALMARLAAELDGHALNEVSATLGS